MICKSCSNEIGNVKFCPHCGAQNINYISDEDSLLNRPKFDRDEQDTNESLLNNDYEDIQREETASEKFGEELHSEPRREVFDDEDDSEYRFNDYETENHQFNQDANRSDNSERDSTYSQGVGASGSTNENSDYTNYNRYENESNDKLWDFLGKVNRSVNPIASKIHDMGILGLIALVLIISLINRFSIRAAEPYFTPRMFFGGIISSAIGVAILFFFNRFVFNFVSKQNNVYVNNDELNVCILLSMLLGSFISLAFGNSIFISILNSIISTLFLLALVRRRLTIDNYKSVGIRYVIFNIIFVFIFYAILFGVVFALLALTFR